MKLGRIRKLQEDTQFMRAQIKILMDKIEKQDVKIKDLKEGFNKKTDYLDDRIDFLNFIKNNPQPYKVGDRLKDNKDRIVTSISAEKNGYYLYDWVIEHVDIKTGIKGKMFFKMNCEKSI